MKVLVVLARVAAVFARLLFGLLVLGLCIVAFGVWTLWMSNPTYDHHDYIGSLVRLGISLVVFVFLGWLWESWRGTRE